MVYEYGMCMVYVHYVWYVCVYDMCVCIVCVYVRMCFVCLHCMHLKIVNYYSIDMVDVFTRKKLNKYKSDVCICIKRVNVYLHVPCIYAGIKCARNLPNFFSFFLLYSFHAIFRLISKRNNYLQYISIV